MTGKRKFTDSQINLALKQLERGLKAEDLCPKLEITEQTLYRWKKLYADNADGTTKETIRKQVTNHHKSALRADNLPPNWEIIQTKILATMTTISHDIFTLLHRKSKVRPAGQKRT